MLPATSPVWAWALGLATAAGWLGVGVLLVFVLARIFRPDTNIVLIWADAYTFWIYQPAYVVAAFAGFARRWWLLGAAGAVVAFHLAWVLPDYRPAEDISPGAQEAPGLRLMTINVYFGNSDFSGIASEVLEVDPDLLFLQEYGGELETALRDAGVEARYPHRQTAYENPFFGLAIYSKLSLLDMEVVDAGRRPFIRATVEVEGTRVRLYNLHPTSPGPGDQVARDWNAGWKEIIEAIEAEEGPLIVAGDLNINQHHRWYRELKSTGLKNSHEERGRGNATTWPRGRRLWPIRIDHVFHSREIVSLSIREGRGEGSDHKPVIAELAILPR